MYLEVNATKTLNEYLTDNPGLFDGLDGYSWDDNAQEWRNTGITEGTKTLFEEWFGERIICHDDKFPRFFRRAWNDCAYRYAQQVRLELSAFDPLVTNYMEREIKGQTAKTSAGNRQGQSSGSNSSDVIQNGTNEQIRTPELSESTTRTFTPGVKSKESEVLTPRVMRSEKETITPQGVKKITKEHAPLNYYEQEETIGAGGEQITEQIDAGKTITKRKDEAIQKQGQKNSPMSISYQQGGGSGPSIGSGSGGSSIGSDGEYAYNYSKLPDYDWQTLSNQAQSDSANVGKEEVESSSGKVKVTTKNPTTKRSFGGTDKNTEEESYLNYKEVHEKEETRVIGTDERVKTSEILSGQDKTIDSTQHVGRETVRDTNAGTTHTQGQSSGVSSETTSGTESGSNQTREIYTGRTGLTPQEALRQAAEYIKGADAWSWLFKKMDSCFLAVYNI